jgi:CheY-like chemotaxis protein
MAQLEAETVLLVDAFADEREMYAEFLEREGFRVARCATASAAVESVRSSRICAVVTRVRQPGDLDGIALTRLLKADAASSWIPVVVITSHIEPRVRLAATDAGCDAFLLIPCTPDQLVRELRRVLKDQSEPADGPA